MALVHPVTGFVYRSENMHALFRQADTDGSGSINVKELR